jgi:hypothetical protein|tara:strand:+ start:187 stop:1050 length:864 start_codon:yes stop_codon:yes gene_type:complete
MKSRVCKKCKTEKLLSEFRDNRTQCKVCSNLEGKEWREKNKHNSEYKRKKRESNKKYKEENTEKIKKQTKKYYEENREVIITQMKDNYQKNKEKYKESSKLWRKNNSKKYEEIKENYKERQKELRKIRYQKNKVEENQKSKEYFQTNKDSEHYRKTKQIYKKERKKNDKLFDLRVKVAGRVYMAFRNKGYSKNTITEKMIGCSWIELKERIEVQFTKGMNWDNYGDWQIDHIIPLSSSKDVEEMNKLCHFINLQPMWKKENLSKSDKFEEKEKIQYLEWIEEERIFK